ncbi:MAG: hypothetical protein EPO21_12570 [Chloroflexota bacterium]|nr:MAG: hypothetical protein EPO21_12570 [Chloroflexota bacterium]
MTRKHHSSLGPAWLSRVLVFVLTAASLFVGSGAAAIETRRVMAQTLDVGVGYCDVGSPAQDLTLFAGDLGIGVPLPERFGNGTASPVTFTTTMKANRFFGPERVVSQFIVSPGTSLIVSHQFLGITETTPLGTGTVVIEVTSNVTGATVLGRCTFNLTVTRRAEQRDVIGIPLRPCFLEGTEPTFIFDVETRTFKLIPPGQLVPPDYVIRLIDEVNDKVWLKQARIVFRAAISAGVPILKDPRTESSGRRTPPGEVEVPALGGVRPETEPGIIKTACEEAWQRIDPFQKGLPVVFVRRFPNSGGILGFVPGPDFELIQNRANLPAGMSTRLCQQPRELRQGDVTQVGWTMLLEPAAPIPTNTFAQTVETLAHELGHTLLLGHGNGLDDDRNGLLPPQPGPRRFDENCDTRGRTSDTTPLEDLLTPFVSCETTGSVMSVARPCLNLRPLQIEQARAAAKLVPGAVFEASRDPAGAFVADLDDASITGIPPDVLLASVEIAKTVELAVTEISQTIVGALPRTAHNRYTTLVDLDNNGATGCNPAVLGLPTAFTGAELVTSVLLDALPGQSPRLSPTVWRCQSGTLVPLSASAISARANDTELTDTVGRLLGRIRVQIPSLLVGPHSDTVRVQAFAEQLGTGGKMSRLPVAPDTGGLIILSAPALPVCSVRAPVVNPGSITRVQATNLPAGQQVDVAIGGEAVGTGEVSASGIVDVELPVPSTSPLGLRPVTVQVRDTLFSAPCEVEVIGNAVTPITTASITPSPNSAGWNNSTVTVALNTSTVGAPLTSLTFSATGAQTIPSTTVSGASASIDITAEGITVVTFFATDSAGNVEPAKTLTIQLDRTPPPLVLVVPQPNELLQDGITLTATINDTTSGTIESFFSIRKDDGGEGTPIGFERLPATFNRATANWELAFDTTRLPDGFYVILLDARDAADNRSQALFKAIKTRPSTARVLKTGNPSTVTPGGLITNTATIALGRARDGVTVEDILVGGGRFPDSSFVPGSARLNGVPLPDPTLLFNQLNRIHYRFDLGNLSAGVHTLTFQWRVSSNLRCETKPSVLNGANLSATGVVGHLSTSAFRTPVVCATDS